MAAADWRRVIDINLTGTFLMTHAMLPLMKDSGWGRIINLSSGSVFGGVPGQTHYVAGKAGLIGLSRSLAREVGVYGITVNVVTPGLTVTKAAHDTFRPLLLAAQREGRPIQRDQLAEDLVGPSSSWPRRTLISSPGRSSTSTGDRAGCAARPPGLPIKASPVCFLLLGHPVLVRPGGAAVAAGR
jgi:NAD(P)-dependent dehydrogenase (short-subunit alcohol dehydrogenase family)